MALPSGQIERATELSWPEIKKRVGRVFEAAIEIGLPSQTSSAENIQRGLRATERRILGWRGAGEHGDVDVTFVFLEHIGDIGIAPAVTPARDVVGAQDYQRRRPLARTSRAMIEAKNFVTAEGRSVITLIMHPAPVDRRIGGNDPNPLSGEKGAVSLAHGCN